MKKLIYISIMIFIAETCFSYLAQAQPTQTMILGGTAALTQDQKDSIIRDNNYAKREEKKKQADEAKEARRQNDSIRKYKNYAKKFKLVKDPSAHSEIDKLQAEVRQGLQGTSNNILLLQSQFAKQQIVNKKFIDSLNYLLEQYKKLTSGSAGPVNSVSSVKHDPNGLKGPPGAKGDQGVPGKNGLNAIVAMTLPGPNTSTTNILNASSDDLIKALHDSTVIFNLGNALKAEADKNHLDLGGPNGNPGGNGQTMTPGQFKQLIDSLTKTGLVGPQGIQGERGPAGVFDTALVLSMINQYLDLADGDSKPAGDTSGVPVAKNSAPNTPSKHGVDGNGKFVPVGDGKNDPTGKKRNPSARTKIPSDSTSAPGLAKNGNEPEKAKTDQGPLKIIVNIHRIHRISQ